MSAGELETLNVPYSTISDGIGDLTVKPDTVVHLVRHENGRLSLKLQVPLVQADKTTEHLVIIPLTQFNREPRQWTKLHKLERVKLHRVYFQALPKNVPHIAVFVRLGYFDDRHFNFRGNAWVCNELNPENSRPDLFIVANGYKDEILRPFYDLALV